MKIFTSEGKWRDVSGDAGFVDDILTVGGENNRQIVVKDSNGEVLGMMSKDGIELNNAIFNNLQSESIVPIQKAVTYYVNANTGDDNNDGLSSSTPVKSISTAILALKNRNLTQTCTIEIAAGKYNENLLIEGCSGAGMLVLNFASGVTINGLIDIRGCSNMISLAGNNTVLNHNEDTLNYAVGVNFCTHVRIANFSINGQANTQHGILVYRGSTVSVKDSKINNITNTKSATITAYENSQVYIDNVIGSNNYRSLWSASGSIITATSKIPMGTIANAQTTGQIFGTPTPTANSGSTPTAPTVITKTLTLAGTSFKFWRTSLAKWQSGIYIGDYSKSTGGSGTGGNNLAVIGIDMASIRSKLKGKTITGVKVAIQRKTSGGYDTTTTPYLAITTSDGTGSTPAVTKQIASLGGFTKGQARTVSVPVSVINDIITNTSVKSFMLYRPDQKQYSIYEDKFTIAITYEEAISTLDVPMTFEEPVF